MLKSLLARPLLIETGAFVLALLAILGAWSFQIFGGYVPCKLCLEQRIPYYIGLPILALVLIARKFGLKGKGAALGLGISALIILASTVIATYQAGAEWDFWPGPDDCGGGVSVTEDAGNLLSAMKATRIVSCINPSLRILGLSFAGWDAVVTAIVGLVLLASAFRHFKTARN